MSLQLKIEYLAAIRIRYYRSRKREKTKILDELCAVSGFSRKYAIRILAHKHLERPKRSGRNRTYSDVSIFHLKRLWHLLGRMCSKKMVVALPVWIEFYKDPNLDLSAKSEILTMSYSTIDRYLRQYKAKFARSKRAGTKPGKMLKNVIPVKSFDLKIDRPEYDDFSLAA